MKKNDIKKPKKKSKNNTGIWLLCITIILYIIAFILNPSRTVASLNFTKGITLQIAPIFFIIIIFMVVIDYFITPQKISGWVGKKSGIKGYIISISTGILSHGPIFIWYSLLKSLKERGMKNGLIAIFLYNRAIKLPLIPMLIYYFGLTFSLVLLGTMVLASIVQGFVIEYFTNVN
ncbi:MAG: permease [Candidatus Aenigmatarchaeota archaeon]